jgi:hypothetical protein
MHIYPIYIGIFKRLSQLNFKIHKVDRQECLVIDGDIVYH